MKQKILQAKFEADEVLFLDPGTLMWHTLNDINLLGWKMITNVGAIIAKDTEELKYVAVFQEIK